MFLSIDGCDGTGKSTQVERLAAWLRSLEAPRLRRSLLALLAGAAILAASPMLARYLPMLQNNYRVLSGQEVKRPAREELQLLHHELAEWLRERGYEPENVLSFEDDTRLLDDRECDFLEYQ